MVKTQRTASHAVKAYNPYLDVLKGFAILLVVLGHSLQTFVADGKFDDNLLFRIIYSFHMPLFMFLAGAAASYSNRPMNWRFLWRKLYMLVVPFFAWCGVEYFSLGFYHQKSFLTYLHSVILSPDNGLWFLWVLFLNFGVLALVAWLYKWLKVYGYLFVWLIIYAIPTGHYGIGLVKLHFPFFALGYLVYKHQQRLMKFRTAAIIICIILAPILIASWHRTSLPHFVTSEGPRLAAHGLQTISIGDIGNFNTYSLGVLAYQYLVPLTAIGLVLWLFQLSWLRRSWRFWGFFGLYSLDLYVLQMNFFKFAIGSGWLAIVSGFLVATIMSLAIGILILRRVQILSVIFLGGRSKPVDLVLRKKSEKITPH